MAGSPEGFITQYEALLVGLINKYFPDFALSSVSVVIRRVRLMQRGCSGEPVGEFVARKPLRYRLPGKFNLRSVHSNIVCSEENETSSVELVICC